MQPRTYPPNALEPQASARAGTRVEETLLTERDLARRWNLKSAKKLQADRAKGVGCHYVKIGSLVRYRLADVMEFEERNLRASTTNSN